MEVKVGAAEFEALGLGHAGCSHVSIVGGAGEVRLDFSGSWQRDATVDVRVALVLRLPRSIGVSMKGRRFLAELNQPGFLERDGVLYSENWDRAAIKVRITARAALGDVTVAWLDDA